MTLKGHKQLSKAERELMARLMHLHIDFHPSRIGQIFGVHAQYVRQQFREFDLREMASAQTLFDYLAKHFKTPHL